MQKEIPMRNTKKIICVLLAISMVVGALAMSVAAITYNVDKLSPENGGELPINVLDRDMKLAKNPPASAFASDGSPIAPSVYDTDKSFFEDEFLKVNPEVGEYINQDYEKFPAANNKTNLQSLGTATYANINGKTVMADAFYRQKSEALNDPNAGLGLLLYQCIQYKIKNPDADVEVCFSSYRTSPTIAVCVLPQSRYYGYMRSLYGEGNDYDNNGFVRISFMLVEAAKLGIDVTIVGQLNSYKVKQYNAEGTLINFQEPSYIEYFKAGLEQDCYSKYADGKKVSDFMTFRPVEWSLEDKGGTDMMHVKSLTVSHYLATDGTEYEKAIFLSSSNLDAIDYLGRNGNNGSQSGVILTGHDEIYNATVNYIKLMAKYYKQEAIYEMRNLINERNTAQAQLIFEGREAEIPQEEQLIWLGSDTDKIFKVMFTPLPGDMSAWNPDYNPYVEHVQNMYNSTLNHPDEPIIFNFNCANYSNGFNIAETMEVLITKTFNEHKHPENRLCIQAGNYEWDSLANLEVGKDLAFKYFNTKSHGIHAKDLMFSYVKDYKRQYVSLLSSCNFHSGALYYQTNSILTITETEETGNVFFMNFGKASTAGCIVDEGMTFSENERYSMTKEMSELPQTFEATLKLDPATPSVNNSYGMLLSNKDYWHSEVSYEIAEDGHPKVTMWERLADATVKKNVFTFDKVDVRAHKQTHLAIVHDREKAQMLCYVNGELKQTVKQSDISKNDPIQSYGMKNNLVVGGSWMGSNGDYFTGVISKVAVWSDVRTASEIRKDAHRKDFVPDENTIAAYDFTLPTDIRTNDLSANGCHLAKEILWQNVNDVAPVENFAYSFAVLGDIQELSEDYFNDHYLSDKTNGDPYDNEYSDEDTNPYDNKTEYLEMLYNWLIVNKDEHKIKYVMGLGDMTQKSYTAEWDYAKEQLYKLNGIIPFSVVRGNHDKVEPQLWKKVNGKNYYDPDLRFNSLFNKTFNDSVYRAQIDGSYESGDMSNTYNAFTVGNTKYLLLNLDYGASDAVLNWADGIIRKYSDHRVIIITHCYLFRDGTTLDRNDAYPASKSQGGENDGDDMWNKLVSKHKNIILVLSGHDPTDNVVCTRTEGINGNTVTQLLINPQHMDSKLGSTATIAMLYFSEDGNTVTVRYYSVARNQYASEKSQFTFNVG
ncbi:MAG: hypothetical protein E7607_06595 [Ruminococcaceae bacterium]|nr:hypothetical protein [Oscillospiraceae bacterium]